MRQRLTVISMEMELQVFHLQLMLMVMAWWMVAVHTVCSVMMQPLIFKINGAVDILMHQVIYGM